MSSEVGVGGGEVMLRDLARAAAAFTDVACLVPDGTPLSDFLKDAGLPVLHDIGRWPSDLVIANDAASLKRLRPSTRRARTVFICHGEWQTSLKINLWCAAIGARIFAVSGQVAAAVHNHGGYHRGVAVLNYGPASTHSAPSRGRRISARAALGIDPEDFVAAFVGRLHPVKRPEMFVEATELAGVVGAMAISSTFGSQSETSALTASQQWLGRPHLRSTLNADSGAVLDAADIYVSTSERESLGLSLLEACARGLPIISTAEGGPHDYLLDEFNALVRPQADAQVIAGLIQRLRDDNALRRRLADAAQSVVASRGADHAVKELFSVW